MGNKSLVIVVALCGIFAAGSRPEAADSNVVLRLQQDGHMIQEHHHGNSVHGLLHAAHKHEVINSTRHFKHRGHDSLAASQAHDVANAGVTPRHSFEKKRLYAASAALLSYAMLVGMAMWSYSDPARRLHILKGIKAMLYSAIFSSVIPVSYQLVEHLGFGATTSGWLIGFCCAPEVIGTTLMAYTIDHLRSEQLRVLYVTSFASIAIALVSFGVVANPQHLTIGLGYDGYIQLTWLFFCRFWVGLIIGMLSVMEARFYIQITARRDFTSMELYFSIMNTVGHGVGPMLASAAGWAASADTVEEEATFVSWAMAVLWICILAVGMFVMPNSLNEMIEVKQEKDLQDAMLIDNDSGNNNAVEGLCPSVQKKIWLATILFGIERAISVSSVQSATSFILESEFHWKPFGVGIAVGITLLCSAPFMLVAKATQGFLGASDVHAMVGVSILAMLACVLFIPGMHTFGWHDEFPVLLADCLIFPSFYFANAIMDGLAIRCCRAGTPYSIENFKVWNSWGRGTVARGAAPALARNLIDRQGRLAYAFFQLALSVSGCAACVGVASEVFHGKRLKPVNGREKMAEDARPSSQANLEDKSKAEDYVAREGEDG